MSRLLTSKELDLLLTSPKEFLSNPKNAEKVLGADLASRKTLKEQIAKKMGVDSRELLLKMAGSGVDEYYAVTSVCNFRSRAAEEKLKTRRARQMSTRSRRS
jgi:hypothetical protein